eukprot:231065_1
MLETVCSEFINDMFELQNEYYLSFIFIGIIVASVLMYNKTIQTKRISSLSSIQPNQRFRKDDPDTRYDDDGTRYQCVSVPYRIVNNSKVEIFMITSRKLGDYIFPGGGWEWKESGPQCACREALEEAGVEGTITAQLVSDQHYTSDKGNKSRLWGFLLEVRHVRDTWPEQERHRQWMSIDDVDKSLSAKRRIKFGKLWSKTMKYFMERKLYNLKRKKT